MGAQGWGVGTGRREPRKSAGRVNGSGFSDERSESWAWKVDVPGQGSEVPLLHPSRRGPVLGFKGCRCQNEQPEIRYWWFQGDEVLKSLDLSQGSEVRGQGF